MNGDGVKHLIGSMTETPERGAAWLFRGLLTVLIIVVGWLIQDKLSQIDKTRESIWMTVAKLTQAQADNNTVMAKVEMTVSDYIKNQERIISQLATEENDHEQRLRQLEMPPRRAPP